MIRPAWMSNTLDFIVAIFQLELETSISRARFALRSRDFPARAVYFARLICTSKLRFPARAGNLYFKVAISS